MQEDKIYNTSHDIEEFSNVDLQKDTIPLFIGESSCLAEVKKQARIIAKTNSSIVITGESGTGKDVLAHSIHMMSHRAKAPFVAINCSAIPDELLESELFGHIKGAFTGAVEKKTGLFEEASGGTLFLDEIADLNYKLQSKLLRVVQERKIRRIGDLQEKDIDVRIICATHKNLLNLIKENKFREDLYYRLNVVPLHIPPLRERKDDIRILSEAFIKKYAQRDARLGISIADKAYDYLIAQSWPGNVRELENAIERAIILCQSNLIQETDFSNHKEHTVHDVFVPNPHVQETKIPLKNTQDLQTPVDVFFSIDRVMSLEELTNNYIKTVLIHNRYSKEKTYRDLNINRKTLYRRLTMIDNPPQA